MTDRLRFGIWLGPFHRPHQNPTLALRHDLALIEHLDRLGFDEAWFGEHHSGGWEIIPSPEVMIAAAGERTTRIRLGTGVSSLAYHHPLVLADRLVMLDHLTRGRLMFGAGPGSLPSDAYMMGIDPLEQRRMMEESLEAIIALLRCDEPVTRETDWFQLREARLQMRPYSERLDVRVAAMISPSGPRAAGRFGTGILSVGATIRDGFNALAATWGIAEERAAEFGTTLERDRWGLVGPMHIAETEQEARSDVRYGLPAWLDYFKHASPLPLGAEASDLDAAIDELQDTGFIVVGTPEMAIDQIQRLLDQSGGFGCFLVFGHDWADREATHRSYELLARDVIPHFQGQAATRTRNYEWIRTNAPRFMGEFASAQEKARAEHEAEQRERTETPAPAPGS